VSPPGNSEFKPVVGAGSSPSSWVARARRDYDEAMAAYVSPEHLRYESEAFRKTYEEELGPHATRREHELQLADYLDRDVFPVADPGDGIGRLIDRLRTCRQVSHAGYRQAYDPETNEPMGPATFVLMWDDKCGQRRLCPDEALADGLRVADMYIQPILKWVRAGLWRRVYYHVYTVPTVPMGQLDAAIKRVKKRLGNIWRKAKRRGHHSTLDHIRGMLVVLEVHRTADAKWHPHLNVIVLTEGRFDYAEVRREWGYNVHQELIDHSRPGALADAIAEICKYVAAIAGSKHHDHQGRLFRGGDAPQPAPPMIEWPAEAWLEWWRVMRRIRRVWSYGVLFKVQRPTKPEPPPCIIWLVGRATFDRAARRYMISMVEPRLVDLTQGHNSTRRDHVARPPPIVRARAPASYSDTPVL